MKRNPFPDILSFSHNSGQISDNTTTWEFSSANIDLQLRQKCNTGQAALLL